MDNRGHTNDYVLTILQVAEELNQLNDVDAILDKILYESRMLSGADAGSIFLVDSAGTGLTFSYVQNDTLFDENETNAAVYNNMVVPISEGSIVGYAALSQKSLIIDNAYELDQCLPYSFNKSFDEKSGYCTTSILTIPLKSTNNRLVGVMQLINAKDKAGNSVPFSDESKTYVPLFCSHAALAIERGIMNRELILRMMQMAELRDPTETGAHVQRVGAYCAEIYSRWAHKRKLPEKDIKRYRDRIRLAAMLHDVGKVGIPDSILKKPGKLTDEEFTQVKWHTVMGAKLFGNLTSELDRMSRDIALNHHEKFAGGGYPGVINDLKANDVKLGTPKAGEDIPLAARICALADVFDALSSPRSYKDPWPDEKILSVLKEERGKQFDPEIVDAFMEIFPVIKAIRSKYQELPNA